MQFFPHPLVLDIFISTLFQKSQTCLNLGPLSGIFTTTKKLTLRVFTNDAEDISQSQTMSQQCNIQFGLTFWHLKLECDSEERDSVPICIVNSIIQPSANQNSCVGPSGADIPSNYSLHWWHTTGSYGRPRCGFSWRWNARDLQGVEKRTVKIMGPQAGKTALWKPTPSHKNLQNCRF